MADTKIEWTDKTWNPVVGCTKVSQGCKHCYAKTLHDQRHQAFKDYGGVFPANGKPIPAQYAEPFETVQLMPERLEDPLRWRKPQRVFVNSVSDLFHPDVPFEFIHKVFCVMMNASRHTFQILTKRPGRMLEFMRWEQSRAQLEADYVLLPLPNVWLGTSVENQDAADKRIPYLLQTPAAVRFLSCEPLLGPVDLTNVSAARDEVPDHIDALKGIVYTSYPPCEFAKLHWVIVGGESGKGALPMHPDWARSLRDQCEQASVPYFFKQWGAHAVVYERDLEDPDWRRCSEIERATPLGQWLNTAGGSGFHGERVVRVEPTKKRSAGRLLDGVEHSAYPKPHEADATPSA